jgi:hypothetical protein
MGSVTDHCHPDAAAWGSNPGIAPDPNREPPIVEWAYAAGALNRRSTVQRL